MAATQSKQEKHKHTCMSERGLSADLTSVAGLRGNPGPPPAMSVVLHVFKIRTVRKVNVILEIPLFNSSSSLYWDLSGLPHHLLCRVSRQLPFGFRLTKSEFIIMVKTSPHLA